MTSVLPSELLSLLGVNCDQKSNRLSFCCCFHDDKNPSAAFYEDTGLAYCFTCGYTLDVVAFYARYHSISYGEAERSLYKHFGREPPEHKPVDHMEADKAKILLEGRLTEVKGILGSERCLDYFELEEIADRILFAIAKGQLEESRLDIALNSWLYKVEEKTYGSQPVHDRRVPEDRHHAGLEDEARDLPGPTRQRAGRDLEGSGSTDSSGVVPPAASERSVEHARTSGQSESFIEEDLL